jgi:hypothetical protein
MLIKHVIFLLFVLPFCTAPIKRDFSKLHKAECKNSYPLSTEANDALLCVREYTEKCNLFILF